MQDLLESLGFSNFAKGAIGFEPLLKQLSDYSSALPKLPTYPPYNIRKTGENTYVIELAVAGFGRQDLELNFEGNTLTVKGKITSETTSNGSDYLFKGIADRAFSRSFVLADSVEVKNADLVNGMLKIWLERFIPEHKRARKIDIMSGLPEESLQQIKADTLETADLSLASKGKQKVAA